MDNGLLLTLVALLSSAGPDLAQSAGPPAVALPAAPPPAAPPWAVSPATNVGWVAEEYADENRIYFSSEYLLWWVKGQSISVPLATFALPPFTPNSGTL